MDNKSVDFLIIGQGIAGTVLAYRLLKAGKQIAIIDNNHKTAATKLAMGIMNPITGRRFVKSWQYELLVETALELYNQFESEFDIEIINKRNIVRILQNHKSYNDWQARSSDPEYNKYMLDEAQINIEDSFFEDTHIVEIENSYQINVSSIITFFQSYFSKKGLIINETFDYNQLDITDNINYKDITASQIIFAEGSHAVNNPYFNFLPFNLSKGEILEMDIPQFDFDKMLKDDLYYIKNKDGIYWVGANYEWKDLTHLPTAKSKELLLSKLHPKINKYTIVNQMAAVRPTVKDRRPLLGTHHKHQNVHIFNGMGTKGTSMVPYFSQVMIDYLLSNKALDKEICIDRFG